MSVRFLSPYPSQGPSSSSSSSLLRPCLQRRPPWRGLALWLLTRHHATTVLGSSSTDRGFLPAGNRDTTRHDTTRHDTTRHKQPGCGDWQTGAPCGLTSIIEADIQASKKSSGAPPLLSRSYVSHAMAATSTATTASICDFLAQLSSRRRCGNRDSVAGRGDCLLDPALSCSSSCLAVLVLLE